MKRPLISFKMDRHYYFKRKEDRKLWKENKDCGSFTSFDWKKMVGAISVFHLNPPKLILPNWKENGNENACEIQKRYYPYYSLISNYNMSKIVIWFLSFYFSIHSSKYSCWKIKIFYTLSYFNHFNRIEHLGIKNNGEL